MLLARIARSDKQNARLRQQLKELDDELELSSKSERETQAQAIRTELAAATQRRAEEQAREAALQAQLTQLTSPTARGLNDALGMNLPRRDWGRALERLKKVNDLPNSHHGRILSTGDYVDDAGHYLGSLLEYL